jgi:hypothetical protein
MAKRPKKTQESQDESPEFVVVTFAEDMEQARNYETLLRSDNIPAVIKEQHEHSTDGGGVAVMVPEDFLDEAHVVIESQDAYDDFYDSALEDEDGDDYDFDSDLFEDEF